jgi:hypothetical protein
MQAGDRGLTPIVCACEKCQAMCASSTCLPTPAEARELVRRGYGSRLATYRFEPDPQKLSFVGPAPAGMEGARDLPHTRTGPCTFFHGGRCDLHNPGLKPLEGRLAHHTRHWVPVRLHVAEHWRGKQFESVCAMLERAVPELLPSR